MLVTVVDIVRFGGATPEAVSKYCSYFAMPHYYIKYLTTGFR